jgi:hypothetical protein
MTMAPRRRPFRCVGRGPIPGIGAAGYDYQSWMLAEVHARDKALADKPPPNNCEARTYGV